MALYADWDPLLKDLRELHNVWLKKVESPGEDEARIRGVVFGIEVGSNRIAEEVAKAKPAIPAIIAAWRDHLKYREEADRREIIKGVDDGIQLVIECVERFYENAIADEVGRSDPNMTNGDESKDTC